MRVYLSNLGCKLNQAEIESLARDFSAAGYPVVSDLADADLHVVNSCTVTHVAARDSRKIARRGRRIKSEVKTVLTGCYVNGSPEEVALLAGVDLVVPNEAKERLVAEVERAFPDATASAATDQTSALPYLPLEVLNTRALVKIEDGCNMPCTFCIIPTTRGRQRSRPLADVVAEVGELVAAGLREIVITGVQISSYRCKRQGLFELVQAMLEETEVSRLRLTSIAPWQFDDRLLDLFSSGRICRHFHLSLQSGCDATLRRMRRPYTTAAFATLVDKIRWRIPGVAITTDAIVGFPGESDAEFEESHGFIESVGFARVHAFPFSSRPGTEAESMPDHVAYEVKRARMKRMLAAAAAAESAFSSRQLGHKATVLWERERDGLWLGMTDNYIRVVSTVPQPVNHLALTRLRRIGGQGVEVSRTDDGAESALSALPAPTHQQNSYQEASDRARHRIPG